MTAKIEKSVTVPLPRDAAFRLFTTEIADWWPMARHSVSATQRETARRLRLEPGKGGKILETRQDGKDVAWATITDWTPGRRLSFKWYAGCNPEEATTVAVTFTDQGEKTRVDLVHSGFEALRTRQMAANCRRPCNGAGSLSKAA